MKFKFIVLLSLLFPTIVIADENAKPNQSVFTIRDTDFTIGDEVAKVVIMEYSSLACPHCAHYHKKIFPSIKENFIDKGKVRYVFRDFPTTQPAIMGTMLIHCVKDNKSGFMQTLFETQMFWAFTNEFKQKLLNIAKLGGMSEEEFNACVDNTASTDSMLKQVYSDSQELKLNASPVFYINGEKLEGDLPYEKFHEAITKALEVVK